MDFDLTDDQQAARDLARSIFSDLSTHERLKEVEETESHFDERLWLQLAGAGLLGLSLPETQGGEGMGFVASCILAEEVGRSAALVPVIPTLVLGAAPIAAFGNEALQAHWLPEVAFGTTLLTAALEEPVGGLRDPGTTATPDGDGWRITGTKTNVAAGEIAHAFVVSATTDAGSVELFVVPALSEGLTRTRQVPTDGIPEALVELSEVHVGPEALLRWHGEAGDAGGETLEWLLEHAQTAICIQLAGACKAAVEVTARYVSERRQFDKPIGEFQAVGQRAADAYVDAEAVRLTAWQAAWRLDSGMPAAAEVAVAKFWADDGAQRCVHACQHLHGGVGVDRDYPVHRYFLMVKHLALALGGSAVSLLRLGDLLAGPAPTAAATGA